MYRRREERIKSGWIKHDDVIKQLTRSTGSQTDYFYILRIFVVWVQSQNDHESVLTAFLYHRVYSVFIIMSTRLKTHIMRNDYFATLDVCNWTASLVYPFKETVVLLLILLSQWQDAQN
jgi:uncharacterized membrane protein